METQLIRYIRNNKNEPRGVAIALKVGDGIQYGYSLCHPDKDKWDREKGLLIAKKRAISPDGYKLPEVEDRCSAVLATYKHLSERAVKYFRDLPRENVEYQTDG